MYLSKIEVLGFKSFAHKVNLTFDSGITAIVGPNGCGKTNVVDAIRWALGEQRPTTLRSDKMEDVIFNGTKGRKPLSMAEVSLTIENTKGILPTEYSEVTITRRVYRSGESEYYLNKTLCRLKDIRDLFMDTGMGSDAYSVIELKMVETILSDKADERRRLFEEAAGVTKYKHRRKEAYRRLESVQADLTRVSDIVREVQKAVNSLERQAQKAERYNAMAKQLHELEIALLIREYSGILEKIDPLRQELSVAVDERNRIDVELRQEEALLEVLRSEMEELEERSSDAQSTLSRQIDQVHQLEQSLATARERQKALAANIERFERERIELTAQREAKERSLVELGSRWEEAVAKTKAAQEISDRKQEELAGVDRLVSEKKQEVRSHQDRVIALLHEISELRQRENQARARSDNLKGRIEFISEENSTLEEEIRRNTEQVTILSAEDRELRRKCAEAEVRVHELEDVKNRKLGEIEALRERDFELRSALDRKQAKVDLLKGLIESHGGVSEGAGVLFGDPAWRGRLETTVGDALTTDPRFRVAIEAALGDTAGYVIVRDSATAYEAIEHLKQGQKGKATFLCLDRLPHTLSDAAPVREEGVEGWAWELVRADERHLPAFRALLDATLIVRSLDVARRVGSRYDGVRCVTLDGEAVSARGVVRGGSVRSDEGSTIGRKTQIAELESECSELEAERARLQADLERLQGEVAETDVARLKEHARELEQQTTTVEVRIAQLEFEKKRAQETVDRGVLETERLKKEIATLGRELNEIGPALKSLEEKKTEAERLSGEGSKGLEALESRLAECARVAHDANLDALTRANEQKSLEQEIEHTKATIRTLVETYEQRGREIAAAREELDDLATVAAEAEDALKQAREIVKQLKEQKQEVDKEYAGKRAQVHQIELKLKDERLRHEGSLKAAHDLEFKIQELTMKAESLRTRAKEEFEMDLQPQVFDDAGTFDVAAAREEVRTLKEKLRSLGPVNFAAFDEYKSEKERLDFVNAQKKDLEESEQTLMTTIEEINTTAQKKFLETFELIRENFIATFKGLFDQGDECDLRLEEGVDPLEARIEITARPRGKRPTSIDLLSGGEKTLTAIALLFAIYLVKPSPFCILDEVDAPLDDSNIDRFTRILRKFSTDTQFIVVTHNKRTMEAANALYGVTMEEEGVSKLVSVRFDQPVTN
ncbi:MAG: chromosome partition protein Smc [Bacteroidia bacterium]|nr:MAG: chromosome partition protein Smc [Bacteroidia bacterium]